ncbi:MAG: hypothetical protein ABSD74_19310 [Rhizomicrobium sp.]
MPHEVNSAHAHSRANVRAAGLAAVGIGIRTFSLLALAQYILRFDQHGALTNIFGFWNEYVRPGVSFLLEYTVVVFFRYVLHWSVIFPQSFEDYIGVGLILVGSEMNAGYYDVSSSGARAGFSPLGLGWSILRHGPDLIGRVLLWPARFLMALLFLFAPRPPESIDGPERIQDMLKRYQEEYNSWRLRSILTLIPFCFFGLAALLAMAGVI